MTIQKRATYDDIDCGCLDQIFHRPDPDCTRCGGSGIQTGWIRKRVRAILTERDPHMADGVGRILTTGGEIERADMYAWFLPGTDVHDEDIVIHRNIEWLVKNKVLRYGTHRQPLYIRCELWKTPTKEVITSERV